MYIRTHPRYRYIVLKMLNTIDLISPTDTLKGGRTPDKGWKHVKTSGGRRREAKMSTRTITLGLLVHWTIVFEKEGVRDQVGTNRYYQSSHIGRRQKWRGKDKSSTYSKPLFGGTNTCAGPR